MPFPPAKSFQKKVITNTLLLKRKFLICPRGKIDNFSRRCTQIDFDVKDDIPDPDNPIPDIVMIAGLYKVCST